MSNTSVTQKELDHLVIHNEEVQEIMSDIPHWMIRWGISVITCIIVLLIFFSWFIRYPEIVPARITLSINPPPIRIIAKNNGAISKFFVKEGQYVKKGDYLVALESAGNIRSILALERQLKNYEKGTLASSNFKFLENLGSIQTDYNLWAKMLAERKFHIQSDSFRSEQILYLEQQRKELENITEGLLTQRRLKKRELEIVHNEFKIDQGLFQKNIITRVELESSELKYIQQRLSVEQVMNQIHTNQIQIKEYVKSIHQLKQDARHYLHDLSLTTLDAFQSLQSSLSIWKQNHLLIAPDSGIVSFFDLWALHQSVDMGTPVVSIIPGSTQIIGKLALETRGSGQVKVGQVVNIKLDNYNPQHYGMLKGSIQQISALPKEDILSVDVLLSDGLITTYSHKLNPQAEMTGTAEIITDNLRLIERVFYQFNILLQR